VVTSLARACLFLCVVATADAAEPPGKAKEPPAKAAGTEPALPTVAADAPPIRKLQLELVREGMAYITRCKELMRTNTWAVSDFRKYADVLTETCRTAAELEEKPANRVPWYELRVRRMKDVETLLALNVRAGNVAPQELNLIRFQRLQAEIDLLKLKADVEKAPK
jgi:hypothetical protein